MRKMLFAASALALLAASSAFAGDITTGVNGFNQNNSALQLSLTGLNGVTVGGSLSGEAAAVGNSLSLTANAGNINVSPGNLDQTNTGTQVAGFVGYNSAIGYGTIDAKALGNTATLTATGNIDGGNNGLQQTNSGLEIAGVALINVSSGNLETTAVAVGNAATLNGVNVSAYGGGFDRQTNTGTQAAISYIDGSTFGGTLSTLAQAAGNSLSITAVSDNTQWSQANSGPQYAVNLTTDSFVANDASLSSVAAGNLINVTANNVGNTTFFQGNTAPQIAATYVGNTTFAAGLTVGSTAIGNGVTVKAF